MTDDDMYVIVRTHHGRRDIESGGMILAKADAVRIADRLNEIGEPRETYTVFRLVAMDEP